MNIKKELFFLPLILVVIFSFSWNLFQIDYRGTNYFIILASILLPLSIKNIFNIKPLYFLFFSLPFLFLSVIETVSLFEYKTSTNINTWEVILNTNTEEIKSFYKETNIITILLVTLNILVFIFYLFVLIKEKHDFKLSKRRRSFWLGVFLLLFIDFALKGATTKAFPINLNESLLLYAKEKIKEKDYLELKKNVRYKVNRDKNFKNNNKETIVIVVGESLRRDHLEYYGYERETTPLLKNEDLICYTDVVSPANQSVISLKRIFSKAEHNDVSGYLEYPTLIKAFKEAGYSTYWISTQKVYGFFDSEISYIARESDNIVFKNHEGLDEQLFEPYNKILSKNDKKRIIFIHVLGNHFSYKKRTNSKFEYFDIEKTEDKKQELINQYDDSVRYNDYVLSYFLNQLKKQEGEKSFIMFSDHGESLFDSGEDLCFHSSVQPSKSEFNIPFILWFSKEFKNVHPNIYKQVINNKDSSINLSNLYHALPMLYGIEFDEIDKAKSFFNSSYIPNVNRKVLNSNRDLLNYNSLQTKIK